MKLTITSFFFVLIAFFATVHKGSSFQCYDCIPGSTLYPCDNPTAVSCFKPYTACMKAVGNSGRMLKGCTLPTASDTCYNSDLPITVNGHTYPFSGVYCTCNSNLCNSVGISKVSFAIVAAFVLMSFLAMIH